MRALLLLCLLLVARPVLPQQYNFRNWTLEDGLPQSQVNDILQDDQKHLWIATRGGVSRFDGKDFRTFTKQQGLSSNNITKLFQDSRHRIWIGTSDHGLDVYWHRQFKHYNSSSGLPDTGVNSIAEDQAGVIWVATEQGLFYMANSKFIKYESLPDQAYTALLKSPTGGVWAGTRANGLYLAGKQPQQFTSQNSKLPNNSITALAYHQHKIWIGTETGLATMQENAVAPVPLPATVGTPAVTHFTEDRYGKLWVSLRTQGLLQLNDSTFTHITKFNGLRTNHIKTLASDVEGNIWVGTDGYGLQQYKSPWFVHYFDFEEVTEPRITALALGKTGRLWMGTDEGFAAYMKNGEAHWLQPLAWPQGTTLYGMWARAPEDVWICTSNGVWNLTPQRAKHYTTAQGLPANQVYQCVEDSAGTIWFATDKGAAQFRSGRFNQVKVIGGQTKQRLFSVIRDSKNRLWFGGEKGTLRLYGEKLRHPPELKKFPMEEVTAITEDKNGYLYFGSFNYGIVMLPPHDQPQLINAAKGLPNEGVKSMFVDRSDNLWVGTSRNLLKVHLLPLRQNGSLSYRTFTSQDGFRGIEVGYNAITQTPDGTVWFGTAKGLTKYIPALDHSNKIKPEIMLTDIELYQKPTDWESMGFNVDSATGLPINLRLPYNQNHITFDYQGICLTAPNKVKYKYRLAGQEKQWSPVTKESYATYASLAPGTYTFELLAQNNDGYWTPEPLTYTFTIVPPIWRREWFIGVLLLVIAGSVLSVVRLREQSLVKMNSLLEMRVQHRTRQLERKNREKEMLLQEIHHRVKNNLQIVISMLNLQARHVQDPLALDVMRAVRNRVRSMAILHERLYRHDDLGAIDLEDYFRGICESLYASYGVSEELIALQLKIPAIKVDIDSAITLGLIVNELVSNTLKYAFQANQPGMLCICLEQDEQQQYTLSVSDNGKGLPEGLTQSSRQSFGLQLVASLSKKLNGEINFANDNGTKSILHFTLPS